ncbi:MAG: glycosyltransferase family 2 protein [Clostridiales bacterium]|nr:glycosyltransferase family 2 protein [Clostridiales bacterium]
MISIIVPCYNEEACIDIFYKAIKDVSSNMLDKYGETMEVIFVNDGSSDRTIELVKELASKDEMIKYISFSRNFGKEAAIYAGISRSQGDYVAIMDADLQDPPALLPQMYEAVKSGEYDSAATRRVTRKGEPPIRSFFARRFYKIMNKMTRTEMVDGARDYRLMNRKFADAILSLGEYNRFSKGLFGWVGFKTKWIEFENVERSAGETKWSFWKLLVYALDGVVAFTTAPLVISVFVGFIFAFAAFVFLAFIVIRKLMFGDPVAGWASTISVILFIGGIQMLFIGIVGEYLSKTYLEVKKRPIYILDETNTEEYKINK